MMAPTLVQPAFAAPAHCHHGRSPNNNAMRFRSSQSPPAHSKRAWRIGAPISRISRVTCKAESSGDASEGRVSKLGSKGEFEEALEETGDSLMVVQISTSRCGPCNFMYPYVVELSEEFQEANFSKIVGDESPECAALMKELGARAVPEYRFYKAGELLHQFTGASKGKLRESIEEYI